MTTMSDFSSISNQQKKRRGKESRDSRIRHFIQVGKQQWISEAASTVNKTNVPKVAFYYRVSTDRQVEAATIESQKAKVAEFFSRAFQDDPKALVGIFEDPGYNMESFDPEADIWKLLSLVDSGDVNTIITYDADRILRSTNNRIMEEIRNRLFDRRIRLITASADDILDRSSQAIRLKYTFQSQFSQEEKAKIAERTQRGRRHALEGGRFRLAQFPYGWDVTRDRTKHRTDPTCIVYKVVEGEAKVICDIHHLYLGLPTKYLPYPTGVEQSRGLTPVEIADHLNTLEHLPGVKRSDWIKRLVDSRDVSQKREKSETEKRQRKREAYPLLQRWDKQQIYRILSNDIYHGSLGVMFKKTTAEQIYSADECVNVIEVPKIVPDDIWMRSQATRLKKYNLVKERMHPVSSNSATYWLATKIECPVCGTVLRGQTSSSGERYYNCTRRNRGDADAHPTLRATDIEPVLEPLFRRHLRPDATFEDYWAIFGSKVSHVSEMDSIKKSIETARKRKAEAEEQYSQAFMQKMDLDRAGSPMPDGVFAKVTKNLNQRIKEAEDDVARFEAVLHDRLLKERKQVDADVEEQNHRAVFKLLRSANSVIKLKALGVFAAYAIDKIELKPIELPDLTKASEEEIRELYQRGFIVPADLAKLGWTSRQIYSKLGRSGRKKAISFRYLVKFNNGDVQTLSPLASLVPEVMAANPAHADERGEGGTKFGTQIPKKLISSSKVLHPTFEQAMLRFNAMAAAGAPVEDHTHPHVQKA